MTDIDRFMIPVSDLAPAGSYLKLDQHAYRNLRNRYNTAHSSFRQLFETPNAFSNQTLVEINNQNWASLRHIAEEMLITQSKDLEILNWYMMSQLFTTNPLADLAAAIPIFNQFIDTFWDNLNPMLPDIKLKASDETEKAREIVEFRIKPLFQLVGKSVDSTSFYIPFQMITLCGNITFGDYLQAKSKGHVADLKMVALQSFETSTITTLLALTTIHTELEMAERSIAKKCQAVGAKAISFSFIKTNVLDLINALQFLIGEKISPWPLDEHFHLITHQQVKTSNTAPLSPSSQHIEQETQSHASLSTGNTHNLTDRDHAFQEIKRIADYFKKTEPHSPISFLLDRSIRWGYMSLPELLQEIIGQEKNVLEHINDMTGMDRLDKIELSGHSISLEAIPQATTHSDNHIDTTEKNTSSTTVQESEDNTIQDPQSTSTSTSDNLQDFKW